MAASSNKFTIKFKAPPRQQLWPVPGSQANGNDPPHKAIYAYDPLFCRGATGAAAGTPYSSTPATIPLGLPALPALGATAPYTSDTFKLAPYELGPQTDIPIPGTLWYKRWYYPGTLYPLFSTQADNLIAVDPTQSKNWLAGVGGSARPGRTLAGKQYWEVLIVELPKTVPPPWTDFGLPDWSTTGEPNSPLGPNETGTSTFLPELNTFLNPVIGLWPKCSTFTQFSVIGLDDPAAQFRSIGVTRTKAVMAPTISPATPATSGSPGIYGSVVYSNAVTVTDTLFFPAGYSSEIPAYYIDRNRETCTLNITGDSPTVYHVGGWWSVTPGQSDDVIPPATFSALAWATQQVDSYNGHQYQGLGPTVGPLPLPSNSTFTIQSPVPAMDAMPASSTPNLWGDLFQAPDIDMGVMNGEGTALAVPVTAGDCGYIGDTGVTIPFAPGGANAGKTQGPVFKGRADMLDSIKTPGADPAPGAGDGHGTKGPFPHGVWTGVDLGSLGVGDTVMIATDVDSRKVWFGKNGSWIAPSGAANPAAGTGWACYMDGYAAVGKPGQRNYVPGQSNYYPGVSYRLPGTTCNILFGAKDFKYPPPQGFVPYFARYF